MELGRLIIDSFILGLLVVMAWYLYTALGEGIPIMAHIAIAMFIIAGAGLLIVIACVIVELRDY